MIQGFQAFEWVTLFGIMGAFLRLAIGVTLVAAGLAASGGLMGHVFSGAVGSCLAAWVCYGLIRQRMEPGLTGRGGLAGARDLVRSVRCEHPKGFYSYVLWFGLAFLAYGVLCSADVVLAKRFFSREEAGMFAKAVMVAKIVFFLPLPVAAAMFPKVTSEGEASPESGRLLFKGMAFAALVLFAAGLVCLAFPGWLLRIVARTYDPSLEPVVRGMVLALAPLSLVTLLLNYELAQRRFVVTIPMLLCAAGYVLGAMRWHETPLQIVTVLAVCSLVCLAGALACLPWRQMGRGKRS
jgi:O-antigen/teichoic acid export membrane protein